MYNQAVGQFMFDQRKALEIILYISKKCNDKYHLLKILYFADREHLQKYGRFTCGDSYIAMERGPVPSEVYDMIKHVSSKGTVGNTEYAHLFTEFSVEDGNVVPLRDPDLNYLSESDIECLDKSIEENKNLSEAELIEKSHDDAYNSADLNDVITVENIAITLPEGDSIVEYLRTMYA